MPTLRERFADVLLGDERNKLRDAADLLTEAYQLGPGMYPPEMLVSRLQELDSRYIDLLTRQMTNNASWGLGYELTESDRLRMVDTSRRFYDNDPVTSTVVGVWTDFGFGLRITVTPRDPVGQEAWDAFWKNRSNSYLLGDRSIHELSQTLLVDGDYLLVFFISKLDGSVKMRLVPTEQIKGGPNQDGIYANPEDDRETLYYRREYTKSKASGETLVAYYPDFRAAPEDLDKAELDSDGEVYDAGPQTEVKAVLIAMNNHGCNRGWPMLSTGFPWSAAYKRLLEDRAAVARAVAMYVDKLKVSGGQRAIDAIKNKLESSLANTSTVGIDRNPRPTAGSTWLENDAADRERMPLSTGAGDAQTDGVMLLSMATSVARIYPHWLGHGDAYRLATASAMERPTLRAFNRYQLFWSSVWTDIAKIVFDAWNTYGGHTKIKETDVDVSTDAVITANVGEVTAMGDLLTKVAALGLVDQPDALAVTDQLLRLGLQALGVSNVDEIIGTPGQEKVEQTLAAIKKAEEERAKKEAEQAAALRGEQPNQEPGAQPPAPGTEEPEQGNQPETVEEALAEAYRQLNRLVDPSSRLHLG